MAAPTNAAGIESWDLRERPTRSQVGMPDDKDFVAYEDPDHPRPIEVQLPEDHTLELDDVYLVTFDRIAPASRLDDGDGPVAMDFRPVRKSIAEVHDILSASLASIGADPAVADRWLAAVNARDTEGPAADQRVEDGASVELGYLTIGVAAVFNPTTGDDKATLKFHVNFVH